eukprot:9644735-Ditylum_brightwellii.AAC.1
MKVAAITTVLAAIVGTALSAPAIVWTNSKDASAGVHNSESIGARSLMSSLKSSEESSLDAVVFLLGRDDDGSASLNRLTASGALPNVRSLYNDADVVYHNVDGVESSYAIARDAKNNGQRNVMEVTLSEFYSKMQSLESAAEEANVDGK